AGILALVQFAVMAACHDQAWIGRMGREGPDRRVWLDRQTRRLPALAAIGRTLDRPGRADRAIAGRDEQRVGIVGLLREAPAIGQRELLADPEPYPVLAAVVAREDLARRRGQHGRPAIDDDPDVVDVGIVDAAGNAPPAIAAIGAVQHAVDLDPSPHIAVVGRIDGQRRDARDAHIRAFLGDRRRQFLPAAPAILRAEQRRRPGSGEDDVGIDRIDRDLPNVEPVHRRVEPLEALAAIAALVDAVIGTGEHRARLMRMHTQPEDAALAPQPLHDAPPALAAIGAEPQAAADRAGADRVFACHAFLPRNSVVPAKAETRGSTVAPLDG